MTLKKYHQIRLIVVITLSILVSQSLVLKNYLIPAFAVVIASLTLMLFRRQVKEVLADERDYANAGRAAFLAIQVYSWLTVIPMFILYAFRDTNPGYEPVALTLAFSTCILMIMYSLIFNFQAKVKFSQSKNKFIVLAIVLAIFISIFTLRLFSGEDNWICQNGQWIAHGHPSFPAPTVKCP